MNWLNEFTTEQLLHSLAWTDHYCLARPDSTLDRDYRHVCELIKQALLARL